MNSFLATGAEDSVLSESLITEIVHHWQLTVSVSETISKQGTGANCATSGYFPAL